eukprot:scaffold527_cov368-Prasinococcus_capsulatus_cf.AAC.19
MEAVARNCKQIDEIRRTIILNERTHKSKKGSLEVPYHGGWMETSQPSSTATPLEYLFENSTTTLSPALEPSRNRHVATVK